MKEGCALCLAEETDDTSSTWDVILAGPGTHSVDHIGIIHLVVLLPPPPECWDDKCATMLGLEVLLMCTKSFFFLTLSLFMGKNMPTEARRGCQILWSWSYR